MFFLIYSYRILIFMNIFDYFFQKGHFKGSLKKRAHQHKNFGMGVREGVLTTLLPTLLRRVCYYLILLSYNFIVFYQFLSISIYFFWLRDIENIHELFISKTNFHICAMLHFIKIWNHIMTAWMMIRKSHVNCGACIAKWLWKEQSSLGWHF